MTTPLSFSPPRAPPIQYAAPLGTRWAKEKAAAGGSHAFDLPTDPKQIGLWVLGECIGKGASGRVKLARHQYTGQLAAVKILPLAPLVNSRNSISTLKAKSEKQRLGIDREITMMKLMNHPNIMRIYDVFEGEKELFLVLEYVEGGELFDFLVNRGKMPPGEAVIFFKQIIYGLNYAHTFSIIHRDLKPENILIASLSPPIIKIADWGMAAFAPPSLQLETSCGSPHYASPEIVNGLKYEGNATDIWSCGVILFALLTGRLPFDDKNVRILLSKVKSGKYETPAWMDPLAKDLLSKMLVVDVNMRITIPEILAHPWLQTTQSLSLSRYRAGTRLDFLEPPLPPSPSTLARPLESRAAIDPELFASLRIIWGRHADTHGEIIKRDLCSPAGQGVHAKAFYFLLRKYHEESAKANGQFMSVDATHQKAELKRHTPSGLGSMNLDNRKLDLKLGGFSEKSNGARFGRRNSHIVAPTTYNRLEVMSAAPISVPSSPVTGRAPPMMPMMSCVSTGARDRPASPVGPRPPSVGPSQRHSFDSRARSSTDARTSAAASPCPRPFSVAGVPSGSASRATSHTGGRHCAITNGVGSILPRRGYTFDIPVGRATRSPGLRYPPVRLHQQAPEQPVGDENCSRPISATDLLVRRSSLSSTITMAQNPSVSSTASTTHPESQADRTPHIYAPVPVPAAPGVGVDVLSSVPERRDQHIVLRSPGSQRALDAMVDRITTISVPRSSAPGPEVDHHNGATRVSPSGKGCNQMHRARDDADKENSGIMDECWSHINPDNSRAGLGLGVGRDMGNIVTSNNGEAKTKNEEPRKVTRKRSTLLSPILLPSTMSAKASVPALRSPVVGEFKGWFSNLFHWKGGQNGCGSAVVYSPDDSIATRQGVIGILDDMNVVIEGNSDGDLRCRVEADNRGELKPTRFRVEFHTSLDVNLTASPAPSSSRPWTLGRSPIPSPLPSPNPFQQQQQQRTEVPAGCSTIIMVIREKGSLSTVNAVWKKLEETYGGKERWGDAGMVSIAETTAAY